jgi:uncharacterized GH25 family protein
MKKNLKSFLLLTFVLLSMFTSIIRFLPFTVHATWVEGNITQDTVWTLVDSPFIVVGNITVQPGATLTLEPGVEILFGGKFSFIVKGKLVARGTQSDSIKFSSNKDIPLSGDWGGILFEANELSTLEYCMIEYAVNGITINNGALEIKNSEVKNCSQNGIAILNGNLTLKFSSIMDNLENGIYISGVGQVEILRNDFRLNENGILLTGEQVVNVQIIDNNITLSKQNGIQLDADDYANLAIHSNILSSNNYGFYISGSGSTSITNNSIAYNSFGFYYERITANHTAQFNDIYGNEMGMDVSLAENVTKASVTAEYNYWGDRSGPYHKSLNPEGKGNPAGGDGVNLDFIPFLTANISHLNQRPTAKLIIDKNLVAPNQTVTFIATLSNDDGRVDKYQYDFGDGENSGWTTLSIITHTYSSIGEYTVRLMVMDDFGVKSENTSAVINVQNLTPLEVSLSLETYTIDYGENLSLTIKVTNMGNPVENATVKLHVVGGGSLLSESGLTDAFGDFITVFTAPTVIQTTTVMIIATASKFGYADGSDYDYLEVTPPLVIEAYAEPSVVKSEEQTNIKIQVTYDGTPVSNVIVSAQSNNGSFVTESEITDLNGECTFIFDAPLTVNTIEIAMNFTATKEGYLPGYKQLILIVEPKILVVKVSAAPSTMMSEDTSNMRVHVTYEEKPIANATVEISSSAGGKFSNVTEVTDSEGYAIFVFTAPQVNASTNITIVAVASKLGYANGEGTVMITVNPGVLQMKINVGSTIIGSGAMAEVKVTVTRNDTPVSSVEVTMASNSGSFSPVIGVTNKSGIVVFTFIAPSTSVELNVTITATVTKNGYLPAEESTWVIVSPEVGPRPAFGLPWELIAIVLVVIIVVVFVVLVKLKIIVISWREE